MPIVNTVIDSKLQLNICSFGVRLQIGHLSISLRRVSFIDQALLTRGANALEN